jgi:putative N6-adenine-specific DNA methylase
LKKKNNLTFALNCFIIDIRNKKEIEKMNLNYSVPCHFGLESVVKYELAKIGAENIAAADGKVDFSGGLELIPRANIRLSTGERVRILLAEFYAATFQDLIDEAEAIPFEDFIGENDKFPVKGKALDSTLSSVPKIQATIKKAAVNRLSKTFGREFFEETGELFQIEFTAIKNVFRIYLDSSGAGLHKRGYRPRSNAAPIKETLAAGIIDLSRIRNFGVLYDPFCGSGTILIEALYKAYNIAPGLRRRFAAEKWGLVPEKVWADERAAAKADIKKDAEFEVVGFDNDPEAIALTLENAKNAGIPSKLTAKTRDIKDFAPEKGSIVVTNPPYGERMLEIKDAEKLYKTLGERIGEGVAASVISPHEQFEQFFGRKAFKKRKLYNGMMKCNLYMYKA